MSFNSLLNTKAEVQRYSATQSDTGAIEKTWATIADIKCRIKKSGFGRSSNLATPYADATHIIYAKIKTDVKDEDQIVSDGIVYEVLGVQNDSSKHHLEIITKQIVQL